MVCINNRRPIRKYCEYNFCNGEHQCIVQKKKFAKPKPSEFMLLALANTTHRRMIEEKLKKIQEKENKMNKYSMKKNEKSVTQLKKRALKLANEGFKAR